MRRTGREGVLMPADLNQIRALTFDVGGTVFDWHHTIRDQIERIAAERLVAVDAPRFANEWRREMFAQLARVRAGDLHWMNADELHRLALDTVAPRHPALELSRADCDQLNSVWHRLAAWPDFAPVLPRLRERYTTTVLTVLSFAIAVDCSKYNGLSWDAITSCEYLGHYKPDAAAYHAAIRLLGIAPGQAMMVACHPGDLHAAAEAGLHTAYVARPTESGESPGGDVFAGSFPEREFDVAVADFAGLADALGV
jgi:2-haloacid dehalogenase